MSRVVARSRRSVLPPDDIFLAASGGGPDPRSPATADRVVSLAPPGEMPARAVLDALPAAIYTTDAEGRITYYNEGAAALWGHRPVVGQSEWCGSWKLYWPDGTPLPHDQCPMALALKEKRPIRGLEAVAERPDGSRVPFAPYPTPIFNASGKLVGAINMLVDLTGLRDIETVHERLAAIVESSDDAIVSKDLNGVIVSWNRGAERLFGYSADEVIGKSIMIIIPEEHEHEEPEILARIRRGERVDHYETIRRRKDGSRVNISLTISPVRDGRGRIVGASKIARDITDRKRAEEERNLLVAELSHRVKNTLATVISISHQSFSKADNPEEARHSFDARIRALAQTHGRLAEANWSGIAIETMLVDELAPYRRDDGDNVRLSGPPVALNPRCALTLGLTIHELATNAAKYGALSTRQGRVDVTWTVDREAAELAIRWSEHGGPPVRPPQRRGFGRLLVERVLVSDLHGRVDMDFAPAGFGCAIALPFDEHVARTA
jgi:two-component system, chemotaxis family, CheB/CheR fusion protein